jgi:hypothetical protein
MKAFLDKLASLETAAFEDDDDAAYKRNRSDILGLLARAQTTMPESELSAFRSSVIDALCRICGTHLDLEVLEQSAPAILSDDDVAYIIQNSALARWM